MTVRDRWERLKARWRIIRNSGAELNRRVVIENLLADMATGKRPLPNAEMCRWMALRLGTPKEAWTDYLKKRPDDA